MSLARISSPSDPSGKPTPDRERHIHILRAAERAFVRFGFHATTMQNVAEEAGMSAGNLYRYFRSKEAIVEELCVVDQAQRAEFFATMSGRGDLLHAIGASLREHVLSRPPEKARMIIEIWAEAARNPRIAAIMRTMDEDVLAGLEHVITTGKSSGAVAAALDSRFAARVVFTLVAGLFKRLALEPTFDPEVEGAMAIGILRALFAGALPSAGEL
jgi:TetR/AcrR family transcriptional regulator, repressor for uid operon